MPGVQNRYSTTKVALAKTVPDSSVISTRQVPA